MIRDIGRNAGRALALSVLLWLVGLSGVARADVVTYFHNDISGTPLAATDEGGNLLWKESYRPYGERLLNGASPDANRLWFGGKPQDPDTGLSYLGARYYSPQLGRFTGVDPKAVDPENLHGFNRYAYANNNPYKFVDPDGRSPLVVAYYLIAWMAGGAALGGGTNAAIQYYETGEVQWGGVGGVADAAGDGAMLGLLGGGAALAARTGVARAAKEGAEVVANNAGKKIPNCELCAPPNKRGNAPIGNDGHSVELHHRNQNPNGPLDEMTRTDHRLGDNFKKNHSNTGEEASQIDRSAWRTEQKEYWKKEWDSGRFDDM